MYEMRRERSHTGFAFTLQWAAYGCSSDSTVSIVRLTIVHMNFTASNYCFPSEWLMTLFPAFMLGWDMTGMGKNYTLRGRAGWLTACALIVALSHCNINSPMHFKSYNTSMCPGREPCYRWPILT